MIALKNQLNSITHSQSCISMTESDSVPASEGEIKIESIKELESQIIQDASGSENLNQLLELSKEKDECVKLEALQSLGRVFIHFFDSSILSSLKHKKETKAASGKQLENSLLDGYLIYRGKLVRVLCNATFPEDSLSSLHHTLLQLLCSEAAATGSLSAFIMGRFITKLLHTQPPHILHRLFEKQLEFCDLTHSYLCFMKGLLAPNLTDKYSLENILNIIILVQKHIPQGEDEYKYLVPQKQKQKKIEKKAFLKLTSKVWIQFLSYELPEEVLINVLRTMDTEIIPNMSDPRLLLDFLTSSLNAGGELGILSLKSLVVLIHKHKLEYPHIYTKIYNLLQPEITHSEHFGDFIALFDLVTTSTHLPQYVIASYMKRLARLTLRAPPHSTRPILIAISNMIARHPNCTVMIHRAHREYPDGDPYLATEQDPSKSNAIESCLWELEPLKMHYSPQVSELATKLFFKAPLRGKERSVTDYLGSYQKSFDWLYKKCWEEINAKEVRVKKPTKKHSIEDLEQ